ncbi:hypothetical protein D9T17_12995 [Lysobacter enzymogenes]|uniref:Uncharacterized protein n=1 Tax=Lysobacter enzymogenes TaxID=69 RepID=A0A3N2RGQ2_LYSEN|nr:hypothetical protein D9T17_12995 [Lysobacter enzymogenes]
MREQHQRLGRARRAAGRMRRRERTQLRFVRGGCGRRRRARIGERAAGEHGAAAVARQPQLHAPVGIVAFGP